MIRTYTLPKSVFDFRDRGDNWKVSVDDEKCSDVTLNPSVHSGAMTVHDVMMVLKDLIPKAQFEPGDIVTMHGHVTMSNLLGADQFLVVDGADTGDILRKRYATTLPSDVMLVGLKDGACYSQGPQNLKKVSR